MLYIDQKQYAHIPYPHNLNNGGCVEGRDNAGTSGCGMCCACMMVEHLTTKTLDVEEAVKMAIDNKANLGAGVNMKILGPLVAEKFDLSYRLSESKEEAIEQLRKGGRVIALTTKKEDGTAGLFTKRKHFILLVATDGDQVCILDPYVYPGKFQEEGRAGKVREDAPFLYCSWDVLMEEVNPTACFHLFGRKIP